MLPRLIAFTGLATSGKTTAARFLKGSHDIISFAAPLKRMLRVLVTEEELANKDCRPVALCGKSVREALQSLGTEWGRNMIDPALWLNIAFRTAQLSPRGIVIDDLRMLNEAEAVCAAGGVIVEVVRPGVPRLEHSTEDGIPSHLLHATVLNDNSEDILRARVLAALELGGEL